jgi:YD repeat-containing protein
LEIRQYLNEEEAAVHTMQYDAYGNLKKVIRPENEQGQQMEISYVYDEVVHSYVEKVSNSFDYPDGGKYFGTQGCIGLTCGKSGLINFRGLMQGTLSKQNNIPLNINILNNPNNNGYGKKVKSNGE